MVCTVSSYSAYLGMLGVSFGYSQHCNDGFHTLGADGSIFDSGKETPKTEVRIDMQVAPLGLIAVAGEGHTSTAFAFATFFPDPLQYLR